jgi:hypothetical protein
MSNLPDFKTTLLLFVFCHTTGVVAKIQAQETHYWNLQYGTRANLLGGAVIGSVTDMSATFYNPGAVAKLQDIAVFQAESVWFMNRIRLHAGSGPQHDLTARLFETAPSFYSGSLTFDKAARTRFAYSFLTRQRFRLRMYNNVVDSRDVLDSAPGLEAYSGEVVRELELIENWGGLTVSHLLGKKSSVGLTQYIIFRGQLTRSQVNSQALPAGADPAITNTYKEVDYYTLRALTKLGFYHEMDRYNIGFSLTTPSLGLLGSGTVKTHQAVTLQEVDDAGGTAPYLRSNVQSDLKAVFKSTWAFGFGLSRRLARGRLYFSSELYTAKDAYDVLETRAFQGQSDGESLPNTATIKLETVLNFGVGMEYQLTKGLTGYFSVLTDFSAAPVEVNKYDLVTTNWDIYHVNLGGAFRIYQFDITAGLGLAYGTGTDRQLINFSDVHERNRLLGSLAEIDTRTIRLKFVFGLSYLIDARP